MVDASRAKARSEPRDSRLCRRHVCAWRAPRSSTDVHLREALILFVCLVVAVILHEISHGVVANWFGDDTAKKAGRLTLNPIPHIDPFGSIILPAMGALAHVPG